MITEDYVSFETAKFLKEKGFHVSDISMLVGNDNHPFISGNSGYEFLLQKGQEVYPAPTLSVVMKWLRENHNIKVNVFYNNSNYTIEYFEPNTQTGVGKFVFIGDGYPTYEEACEAAIKYCLENLI